MVNAGRVTHGIKTHATRGSRIQLVRKPAILDVTAYITGDGLGAENPIMTRGATQAVLFVDVTKGSLTTILIKCEMNLAGYGLFQELTASVSKGAATLKPLEYTLQASDLASNAKIYLPLPVLGDHVRVSAKGVGTNTNSLLAMFAIVGRG